MTMDAELERHRRTWIAFTRFLKWVILALIVVLGLMAIFLV
jgi:hypothetical protein